MRGGAVVTNAQLIAYDGFSTTDYATGTNPSANPTGGGQGPGWASPWMPGIFGEQNPITSATGYNSPAGAMPTVGNHVQALNTSDPVTSYMSRTINLPALAEGDSIWFSYQAAVIDANSAAISSNLTLFSSGDFYRMTVWNGPSTQISIEAFDQASSLINLPTPANLTDPYFIVTQILRNPDVTPGNANLTFNLYTVADPNAPVSGSNPLITPTPFLSLTGDGFGLFGPSTFGVDVIGGGVDEFLFGRQLADVTTSPNTQPVPEPATLAILALGAFGALKRRRSSR